MPCWYYDRRELEQMCRHHGLDPKVEARYRKEGARLILDCGAKMGLRYETCATGVVYFHRFYLTHSFREFNRYTTASSCLFLAGKVEETPKKCKDIIRVVRSMLSDQQFASFGEDPREEVMTMERILLQTIRFDLQVEHPYKYLLSYAKFLKGDKEKIEQMVQMAWTFINDSLCTKLCLQWEPDVMAVALMYLGSRLKTFEVTDWHGKTPQSKGKWWNNLVEDITFELLEDVCHQVLDLYSSPSAAASNHDDSPPPPPPPRPPQTAPHNAHNKRSRSNTPSDAPPDLQRDRMSAGPPSKMSRHEQERSKSPSPTPNKDKGSTSSRHPTPHGPGTPVKSRSNHVSPQVPPNHAAAGGGAGAPVPAQQGGTGPPYPRQDGVQYNPFMSAGMYQSSFLSGEGAQNIQDLMSGGGSKKQGEGPPQGSVHYSQHTPPPARPYNQHPYSQQPPYPNYQQPPPPAPGSYQGPPRPGGPPPPYPPNYQQQPPPQGPPPPQQQQQYNQYQYPNYSQPPPQGQSNQPYHPPPPNQGYQGQPQNSQSNPPPPAPYPQQYNPRYSQPPPPAGGPPPSGQYNYSNQGYQQSYQAGPPPPAQGYNSRGPHPPNQGGPHPPGPPPPGGLPTVRITGRR